MCYNIYDDISNLSNQGRYNQIMYDWLNQLIGAPTQNANYYITQGAITIVEGVMCAVSIFVVFVIIRLLWGRRV